MVSINAAEHGIALETLRTDVAATWDPAIFLRLRDTEEDGRPVDQFNGIRVLVTVSGYGLCPHDLAFIDRTVRRSAVFNLIALGREIAVDVRMVDAVNRAE